MEKIQTICVMRELLMALSSLESQIEEAFGVTFNEAMVLCCIASDTVSASTISENTGLLPSRTSKVLRSVESKGLISRAMGHEDRRQMYFSLTPKGKDTLVALKSREIKIPDYIKPLFE